MAPAQIHNYSHFERSWYFADSEEGLRCYALLDSGFEEIPNTTALLRGSQLYRVCILHTAEQQFWEQVGVRQEYLEKVRSAWEIPSKFWEQLWAPRIATLHDSGFQYYSATLDSLANDADPPQHVTVTLNWASFNKFQSIIAHYDIATSRLRVLLRDNGIFWGETALSFLRSHSELLLQQPMAIIGLLLMAGHDAVLADAQNCGAAINKMELSLGVTAEEKVLRASGYTKSGRTLKEENLVLYSMQKSVSRNLRSCDYMSSISNSYDIFATELDRQLLHKIPLHTVRNVVHRLSHTEAYLHHLQRMLQTQSSMLHNLILQEDTKVSQQIADTSKRISEAALTETTAMKTVAYLTLAFLPATFVSSIFSTTIFDFQNWNSEDAIKVTSGGWWIYVLSCLLVTTTTLSVYFYWNQYQRKSSIKRSLDLELNS